MKSIVFIESNFTGIDAIRKAAQVGFKCYLITSSYQMIRSLLPHDIFDGLDQCFELIAGNISEAAGIDGKSLA